MSDVTEVTVLTENLRADLVFVPGGADAILTSIERRARDQRMRVVECSDGREVLA